MLLPAITVEVDDTSGLFINGSRAIPAGMTAMLVVVRLIISELVLQIGRGPKESLIQ